MLTPTGAKVLDFGLARVVHGDHNPATDVTATASVHTERGSVMGTLPYMAPEQFDGRDVDARADVFAFGATLYEMLAGKRAFDAPSGALLMAAILRDEPPPLQSFDVSVPASIERIAATCLAKDPAHRFSSMRDVAIALEWALQDGVKNVAPVEMTPLSMTRRVAIGGALAVFGGAAGFGLGRLRRQPRPLPPRLVFDLSFPPDFVNGPGIAVSPNGRWVAVSMNPGQVLWIYDLHTGQRFRPDRIKTNCFYPFWSPDGNEVGFLSGPIPTPETRVRIRIPDGAPTLVCDIALSGAKTAAWLSDGTIVLAGGSTGLFKVPADGAGRPSDFVALREGEQGLRFPSAAGRHLLFLVVRSGKPSQLEQCSIDGSGRVAVPFATQFSGVSDRGHLFYYRQGAIVGQSYDLDQSRFTGEPERVTLDAIGGSMNVGHLQIGAGGGHVAALSMRHGTRQLVWRDRAGRALASPSHDAAQDSFSLSPDGRYVVIARFVPEQPGRQLFVIDLGDRRGAAAAH